MLCNKYYTMKRTLIIGAMLVSDGGCCPRELVIEGDKISLRAGGSYDEVVNGSGCLLLPGVIDEHVHFRDPGLTHKADVEHESLAAAAGGVTTVMDMPNVVPQTTTNERWRARVASGQARSVVNYHCYLGATNDNIDEIRAMDVEHVPAVKLFMGASTGNMLVDREEALRQIFQESPALIMTHCEDTQRITERMREAERLWGDDPSVEHHAWVRDEECCLRSTQLALRLAEETGARLHVAHVTTRKEVELLLKADPARVSFELCLPHLLFTDEDYQTLGTRIKCNPAVKTRADRDALRLILAGKWMERDRVVDLSLLLGKGAPQPLITVATDHAPHLLTEKEGGCRRAASGMPMVQFSLVSMLGLVEKGVLSWPRLVEVMCHNPARLYGLQNRGFLREGYQADLTLVRRKEWTVTKDDVLSKCGWSPLEGQQMHWQVARTWVNGEQVYAAD